MTLLPKPIKREKRAPKPLKRSRPRKQRKTTVAKLRRMLWERFRNYVKDRDGRICFTCDSGPLEGSNCHAGHLVNSTKASVRYAPFNVYVQCYRCNVSMRGNIAEYAYRYIQRFGKEQFDRLMLQSREHKTWTAHELEALIAAATKSAADYEMFYAEKYWL